jgi:hypothetical protein
MRGLVLCGLLTLFGGVKPLVDGVPIAGAKPSATRSTPGNVSEPVRGGFVARQDRRPDPVSPEVAPGVDCTAIVVDTKPPVDLGMAQPIAGNPDAKMVVPSPCRH